MAVTCCVGDWWPRPRSIPAGPAETGPRRGRDHRLGRCRRAVSRRPAYQHVVHLEDRHGRLKVPLRPGFPRRRQAGRAIATRGRPAGARLRPEWRRPARRGGASRPGRQGEGRERSRISSKGRHTPNSRRSQATTCASRGAVVRCSTESTTSTAVRTFPVRAADGVLPTIWCWAPMDGGRREGSQPPARRCACPGRRATPRGRSGSVPERLGWQQWGSSQRHILKHGIRELGWPHATQATWSRLEARPCGPTPTPSPARPGEELTTSSRARQQPLTGP